MKKEFVIDEHSFEILKKDPKFVAVVNLGRYFNALMSSLNSYLDYSQSETAEGQRQKFAAIWATVGYLHEGLNLFQDLSIEFENDSIFINTIGKLLADPEILKFNKKLASLRSNTAFHFSNKKAVNKVLKELNLKEYVFLSFDSEKTGGMYFQLGDTVNTNYWIVGIKDQAKEEKELRMLLSKSVGLTQKTIIVLQDFIWEYMNSALTDLGITVLERDV